MIRFFLKTIVYSLALLSAYTARAQDFTESELSYSEYLGYVKKYHPLVKQAGLEVSRAQAKLMAARGGFDPRLEIDYDNKEFKGTEYYSVLKSSFKIPTWYGPEIKAGFDETDGTYFNPQNRTPERGLSSLGVKVPLGQGLFINQRMADVREGRILVQRGEAQRKLRATEVLYNASQAYFNWKKAYNEAILYTDYLEFAKIRFRSVKSLIELGDSPAIDSIEARITVRNRELNLENASLKLAKARLEVSNYLWLEQVPVELADGLRPEQDLENTIEFALGTNEMLVQANNIENHPRIQSLRSDLSVLEINRRLNANLLLPKLDVGYYYIAEPHYYSSFPTNDYKFNVNFSFPLFLRKERGNLRFAKLQIQDLEYSIGQEQLELKNRITARQTEVTSLRQQKGIIDGLVNDYTIMLASEERLFEYGESSVFLINSRENNLVNARLNQIDIENQLFIANAQLFRVLANPD